MEYYILIKCGYEGIEGLIMPSNEPDILVDKINMVRKEIADAKVKKSKLLLGGTVDELDEAWFQLWCSVKITEEEWKLPDEEPDSYCIQKWNGVKFECFCDELDVSPDKMWLM